MCIVKQKSQTLELNQIFVPFTFAFSLYVVFRGLLGHIRDKLAWTQNAWDKAVLT